MIPPALRNRAHESKLVTGICVDHPNTILITKDLLGSFRKSHLGKSLAADVKR
jgi:hypothetical protein